MSALGTTLLLFAGWWLVGLGLLALLRSPTSDLRVVLTAPVIGTCVTVLVTFVFSEAGVSVGACALPIVLVLVGGSLIVLAVRRPRVHSGALLVAAICLAGTFLIAWPMLSFGFHWFGNGNDDMTNYVLSAQDLLKRGLLAPVDFKGLSTGRDYASVLTSLHIAGSRPGSDMLLAVASKVIGRPPYQMFMPVIVAFELCGACAAGALALQFTRRWWAAALAASLLLVSPMASYGVLQQLLAQVWGLAVAAALLALLMRRDLHGRNGERASVGDVTQIGILAAGLLFGYPELIPMAGLAYLIYVGILLLRRQATIAALVKLWLPSIVIVVVILNAYLPTELDALKVQVTHGLAAESNPPLFGYVIVPSALPGIFGLQTLPPETLAPNLNLTIVMAMVVIVVLLVVSLVHARRGSAAAITLLVEVALGTLLVLKNSDFGIFKLTMYVQPFIAAVVAGLVARAGSRRLLAGIALGMTVALLAVQLSTQHAYVDASRDPINVPHVSAEDVIPRFHALASRNRPIVSVTTNPVLIKLEAASAEGHSVFFQSRDVFSSFLRSYAGESSGSDRREAERVLGSGLWTTRAFSLREDGGGGAVFEEDTRADRALASDDCELALPSANSEPFNRYSLPATAPDLVTMRCDAARHLLAFVMSNRGESFYLPTIRRNVSFFQLQPDPFFPHQEMVAFGRYALFQILGYSPGDRLVIELTETLTHNGVNSLPPAAVVGSNRARLPLEGRGSARVFSSPIKPQIVNGIPYIMLDMGVNGQLPVIKRSGLQAIYGRSVTVDPNYLTAYVRGISLVGPGQYASLRPPAALTSFPKALDDPDLEYSGIYEDGWMGETAYVRLAGGPAADLAIEGEVPAGAGKHLQVLVGDRTVASLPIAPGPLNVRVPLPSSSTSRRVELRFAATIRLKAPDLRPAAAYLTFLGLVGSKL